ncbi:MAG TPA: Ig-like domain-containing protein [Myxococcus sp.]|nr:Ig-like domain-containing protein [Myxococcus sp.]
MQPRESVFVRQSISIQVTVEGGNADRMELLRDGEVIANLALPYQFAWDVSGVAEARHKVTARAWRGEESFTSNELFVTVDRTGPTVVSREPASGATDVQALAPIVLVFSEPLLGESLGMQSFTLTSGSVSQQLAPLLSAGGRTVTLYPQGTRWGSRDVQLRITQAPTDLAGNPAQGVAAFSWTLAPWLRMPAVTEATGGHATALQFDSTGTPVVAYHQRVDSQSSLVVKRWSGQAWEPMGAPIPLVSQPPLRMALALTSQGHPWLAWIAFKSGRQEVHVQRWTGSAWQSLGASPEQTGLDSYGSSVSLGFDSQGTAYLAAHFNGLSQVQRWTGTAWEGLPVLGVANASATAMVIDSRGPVVAVSGTPIDRIVYSTYVRRWTGTAWQQVGSPFNEAWTDSPANQMLMAVDATGRLTVAYVARDRDGEGTLMYVHALDDNGTAWPRVGSPRVLAPTMNIAYTSWPSLGLDGSGAPLVSHPYTVPEGGTSQETYQVARWDGSAWVALPGLPLGDAREPAHLGTKGDDAPVILIRTWEGLQAYMRLN